MSKTYHVAEQFALPGLASPVPKKPHYSYSALELAKCGAKYYYQKVLKAPRETSYNLVAGTIMDTAFNAYYYNNDHLRETHEQRIAYARAAVDQAFTDNPSWMKMDWSAKAGDVRSSPENYIAWLFDIKALDLICRPDRGYVEVQKKVSIELVDYFIDGYIDCLELETNTIVDVKCVTGFGGTTTLGYALRSQIPLYRMIHSDTTGVMTRGRYELVLCRKKPTLEIIEDFDIDFLQTKLISDFDAHHKKVTVKKDFSRNPDCCFGYNKTCGFFTKCWPELAHLVKTQEQPTTT